MYSLWKNEVYYDPSFEIKKRQENRSLAAQDSNRKIAIAS
jgi:hypothetical protein